MKVLSIQQPWTHLLAYGLKDVENRTWTTSYRGLVLFHADQRVDLSCFFGDRLRQDTWNRWREIVGEKERLIPFSRERYQTGGIVGYATLVDVVTHSESPWYDPAQYGWVFEDAHPLPFIGMRGTLGLFSPPDEMVTKVEQAIEMQRLEEAEKRGRGRDV